MDPSHPEDQVSEEETVNIDNEALEEVEEVDHQSTGSHNAYEGEQADSSPQYDQPEHEEYAEHEGDANDGYSEHSEHSENVSNQDTPQTPHIAPISWKDASKSTQEVLQEAGMPSFTDKAMMDQVELNAKQSAANLVVLVHHLRTQLAQISTLSVQYMSLHKMTIEGTAERIHEGIASTQKLILKAQALNTELRKVHAVQQDIKETKKLLSQLEKVVEKSTKS